MIDISGADELEPAIRSALAPCDSLQAAIETYGLSVTPYLDGASAGRVLRATEEMLNSGWIDKKPLNLWRNLRMRQQLKYYRP